MNRNQKEWLADKLGSLGNTTAAILVIGYFVDSKGILAVSDLILGFLIAVLCYYLGFELLKNVRE